MKITITSSNELNKLLDALAKDIVDANIYYRLFIGLIKSTSEYSDEINQSNTFWWLSLQAIKEAYLIRLCRIFEQNSNSLNLVNLLDTIQSNRRFFDQPHFRERLKDNAFIESLISNVTIPSIEELQSDIEFASDKNPVVLKLTKWRMNVYAHTGARIALGKSDLLKENSISEEEVDQLLNQCFSISNKYMNLYKASAWSRQIVGHDDYLSLFKFLRMGLEKHEEDIQRDIVLWSKKPQ
jgi:hypothetical protein